MTARRSQAGRFRRTVVGAGRAGNCGQGDLREHVRVHGAGRTDAGVHALAQVAHCDIAKHFAPGRLRDGLNAHLRPHPIGVLVAEIVPETFEARFSAIRRHYLYRIVNRRANLAIDAGHVWRVPKPLDTAAMHRPRKH